MNLRKLHIGGQLPTAGWEILDVNPASFVDHIGNAQDLGRFETGTFSAVYASHVLEHFDYKDALAATLSEWHRVLEPGGMLYVSVPDLEVLASLFLRKDSLTIQERFHVMRMIFGGHVDDHDYHLVGFDVHFLTFFLQGAGFVNLRRVTSFDLFQDTSAMFFAGVPISLNMVASKPG